MREKGIAKEAISRALASDVKKVGGGTATYIGERRVREGKGLDPLVDPSQKGVIRQSYNLLVPKGSKFELKYGVAMPIKTDSDTTASMGRNVDTFFGVQPKVQNLLIQGEGAVLGPRYHTQMSTGIIGDRVNRNPYQCSQYEPDNEVEKQMMLLAPERNGGVDTTEDYQNSLLSAARLTDAHIWKYGLKGYYFPLGDERGRDQFEAAILERVFGPDVYEKAGLQRNALPDTRDIAKEVLQKWHTFFLEVVAGVFTVGNARPWWSKLIGRERVVTLQRTEDLAEIQAVLIGLTEGVLDFKSAVDFLRLSGVSQGEATRLVEACKGIPVGEQAKLPNFGKIPKAGSIFATRDDIWPIGSSEAAASKPGKKATSGDESEEKAGKGKKKSWKL